MTITELKTRYAGGATPSEIIGEIRDKTIAWNDPALFIHLPEKSVLLEIAAAVEAMPEGLPLWGIPFVVKDNIDVAGWPTTAGCPEYAYLPTKDAEVVRLLRAAGAIPIAKANMDQFATGLVGTRSPYGVARNAIDAEFLPGGSSSGSASSVAADLCAFSLGTDTAGSGRVPAAFQELIGWKPTRGLLSNRGLVPACRSLDCISVFANTAADALLVSEAVSVYDEADAFSRKVIPKGGIGARFRFGVPVSPDFAGDPDTPGLFAAAVEKLKSLGGTPVMVDLTAFTEAAKLLYEGPWVAERWAAVGGFVEKNPDAVFPVTRKILEGSKGWDAASTFLAQYKLREHARDAEAVWKKIDVLLLPTTPRIHTVAENLQEPYGTNATLGRYTNFMNLLDLAAVAVPAGRARSGRAPWGVTLAAPAGWDVVLLGLAARFRGEPEIEIRKPTRIPLLVCGAHLEGLALHWQLADRGAVLREKTRTAPVYRMFAMPPVGTIPPRPALIRDDERGAGIDVEVWELEAADFGDFVSKIPGPLGIGKVKLENGEEVPGFIAEPRAIEGAGEITDFGGWRAWLERS
ncbi:allophanate hydrolase [Luteolibacter yonseiensis]|uniref:Allophanate hydrolase n=1 Tax=Luteolibacter yonseiensis TaxID=1144680 RepID=A0A934R547_9BACT|nr:allophanate hydrolase [Luteolibacter yonseiensis]MBK1815344.1 allophanate hydrolase [Luteolibacter yonseiensis]